MQEKMKNENTVQPDMYEDEISLGELILNIKDYVLYVLRYWLIIGIVGVLFAVFFVGYTLMQPVQYNAELSFVVKNAGGSKFGSSISSALSSFGISTPSGDGVNYYKILNLAKSKRIHTQALLDSAVVNGKNDFLGNHLISIYNFEGNWEKISDYNLSNDSISKLNLDERKLLKILVNIVAGVENDDALYSISFDEESTVLSSSITTLNEEFSVKLIEAIYNQISQFYVLESISQTAETVQKLEMRKDSLEEMLKSKQFNLAALQDASKGMLYDQYSVRQKNLSREVQIAVTMYLEVVKNLESARFTLSNVRPFFTVIDKPFKPLGTVKKSWLIQGILGGIIGCFLAVVFIVLRRYINEAINAVNEK